MRRLIRSSDVISLVVLPDGRRRRMFLYCRVSVEMGGKAYDSSTLLTRFFAIINILLVRNSAFFPSRMSRIQTFYI